MASFIIILFITIVGAVVYSIIRKLNPISEAKAPEPVAQTLTEWDLRCMAFHESGHAVCSYYLPEREELIKVTICPDEESFGMIKTATSSHHNATETSLSSMISTFLAGPLSEEIFLKVRTTSGIHDFANARSIAVDMVTKFGMGRQLGKLVSSSIYDNSYCLFSEEFRRKTDEDVLAIIRDAEINARNFLVSRSHLVLNLAELLLERQTLEKEEIRAFFNSVESN